MTRGAPKVLITGTGRSGTGYAAALLNRVGVRCGHEEWWNPFGERRPELLADASWCALALGLDDYDGRVFHQHRHPLDVVSSMSHSPEQGLYRDLRLKLMIEDPAHPTDWAALCVITFLEAAEVRSEASWPIAAIPLRRVCRAAGVRCSQHRANLVIDRTKTNINVHYDGLRLGWDQIPSGELRERLRELATRFGY